MKRSTRKNQWQSIFLLFLAIAFSLGIALPARADTTWTFDGVAFTDGGTVTGSFTLNTAGAFTGVSFTTSVGTITTTLGTPMPGATYSLSPLDEYLSANGSFLCANPSYTCLNFFSGLTDLFLVVNVAQLSGLPQLAPGQTMSETLVESPLETSPFDSYEATCISCFGGYTAFREVTGSSLDGVGLAVPPVTTPEPATLSLMAAGLIGVVASRRKRSRC